MALPANFPTPPKRPPSSQPMVGIDGFVTPPWLNYFDAMERYQVLVRQYLASS